MLRNMVFVFSKPLGWRTLSTSVCKMQCDLNTKPTIFKNLESEFQDASYIESKINDEELRDTNIEQWRDCLSVLKWFNFEDSHCFQMIHSHPELVRLPISELKETANTWLACKIGINGLSKAFYKHPSLLDIQSQEIRRRVPHLNVFFQGHESLAKLLLLCPNIMFDDWDEVHSKIKYLIKEKCIRNEKLLQSYALTKPLDFIKLRFEIAEKCGKYIKNTKKPHKRIRFEKTNNPSLMAIVDAPDETFAKSMNITTEEYQFYEDLFNLEGAASDEEDVGSDEEDINSELYNNIPDDKCEIENSIKDSRQNFLKQMKLNKNV